MKPDQPPFFLWRALRRSVFVIAAFISLVTLFYVVENWRGRRAWENYKAELISRGEVLDFSEDVVKPVPAEENFAETPVLRAILFKGKRDTNVWAKFQSIRGVQSFYPMSEQEVRKQDAEEILDAFKAIEPELAELRAAAKRPYAQLTNHNANAFLTDGPDFVALRTLSQLLVVHSFAELASGHSERAFADLEVVHRLADSLGGRSALVMAMIRVALIGLTVQPFEQGLSTGAWSDQQLTAFQKYFESVELLTDFDVAIRGGERNSITKLVEDLPRQQLTEIMTEKNPKDLEDYVFKLAVRWCPRGWLFQNAVNYNRVMQKTFESYDVRSQRVFPEKCDLALEYVFEGLNVITPFKYLVVVGMPNIKRATQTTAQQQNYLRQAALACALERYRRARGEYPEARIALVPEFMAKLPSDVMTGESFKYQRIAKDKFTLYSVGWDLKDDGGTRSTNRMAGDWVWPPTKR